MLPFHQKKASAQVSCFFLRTWFLWRFWWKSLTFDNFVPVLQHFFPPTIWLNFHQKTFNRKSVCCVFFFFLGVVPRWGGWGEVPWSNKQEWALDTRGFTKSHARQLVLHRGLLSPFCCSFLLTRPNKTEQPKKAKVVTGINPFFLVKDHQNKNFFADLAKCVSVKS